MSCYYRMEERVRLLGKEPPEVWENILAVIPHEELSVAPLPTGLRPPPHIVRGKEQRYCRTTFEAGQVAGFFHVPAHTRQATHNCAFTWCGSNVLLVAYDDFVQVCLHRVGQLSAHKNAGSADFIVDFLSVLIQDELPHIQRLEESLSSLEQDVLQGKVSRFIHQMSALRQELNRFNRYYAQLNDMADSVLENVPEWFDSTSLQRLGYFARRVDSLRDETQMLREYASQISTEYQAQIDIAQNRIMKTLTIVTTVFRPLSLIAGWYGMNFAYMPELHWTFGYPAVILLSAVVVCICLYFFKRRHFW